MFDDLKNNDLSYKDIFNISFEIYIRNIGPIIVLCFLVGAPLLILAKFVLLDGIDAILLENSGNIELELLYSYDLHGDVEGIMSLMESWAGIPPAWLSKISNLVIVFYVIASVVFMPLIASGLAGLALATIDNGRGGTMGDMIASSLGNIFKTSATSLLVLLFVGAGVALIFPALYFAVMLAFSVPAIVVTGKWGLGALKESAFSTVGRWFKTLGFLVLVMLFFGACLYLLNMIGMLILQFLPYYEIFGYVFIVIFSIMFMYFTLTQCVWFINKHYMVENLRKSRNIGE